MKANRQNKTNRPDIYQQVTERILEHLEQGAIPWHTPHCATVGFPKNFSTERDYQGVNILLLGMAGFTSPYFLTFLQAKELGGHVRKGEKGFGILKCGSYDKKTGALDKDGNEETESRRFLKGYTVFNSCQIEEIDFPKLELPKFTPSEKVSKAKAILASCSNLPRIVEGNQTRTCYSPDADEIRIPDRAYFESEERFYKSLFHELVHASGAAKRLARPSLLKNKGLVLSGEKIYAKEELVAEIGAAFLCAHVGIVIADHENSAAYLEGWLKVFRAKNNERLIIEAASDAQKAVNWILRKEQPES